MINAFARRSERTISADEIIIIHNIKKIYTNTTKRRLNSRIVDWIYLCTWTYFGNSLLRIEQKTNESISNDQNSLEFHRVRDCRHSRCRTRWQAYRPCLPRSRRWLLIWLRHSDLLPIGENNFEIIYYSVFKLLVYISSTHFPKRRTRLGVRVILATYLLTRL